MIELNKIISVLESAAPLRLQDDYDNSGLQIGFAEDKISRVLLCLDITEEIVDEAIEKNCQLIVSHHPLLFRGLKQISDRTYQQRVAVKAIRSGIAIYSAHTAIDNAPEGVNYKIASLIGLKNLQWLEAKAGENAGSGVIGELEEAVADRDFFAMLSDIFKVECLRHSATFGREIKRVALCGGAGAFLMPKAMAAGADCFVCGEFHYHDYFENGNMLLAELGHYQSEKYTIDLFEEILSGAFGEELELIKTSIDTNPVHYGI